MPLAHGVGGITDPPVPLWLFYYGAAVVLVLSFAALAALWRTPKLERARERPLRSTVLRVVGGIAGFTLFVVVFLAAIAGERSAGSNLAPTFVFVVFWLGLVPLVVLLGNVWSYLNPWRAAADFVAWTWERARLSWDPPGGLPARLGVWPAAALLAAFAALELAYERPDDPRAVGLAIAIYSWVTWLGMTAFGREAWTAQGEAFNVYFGLLARLSPLRNRPPLAGVARTDEPPGTVAFVAVMLGSVLFDGFGRTQTWVDWTFTLGTLTAYAANVAGLVATIAGVAAAFLLATSPTRVPRAFAGTLIPIALAYVVAHYFSLLAGQGQLAIALASDPFGFGWDLFGTADFRIDPRPFSSNTIWYVQVGALVVGHVLGLVAAHDKALALGRGLRTQLPMLALMVLYTVGGLWILSRG